MAYVTDTRVETLIDFGSVPIVQDFWYVFPKEFPGVPLERQVEFYIDLVLGAALIPKEPYRLAPVTLLIRYTLKPLKKTNFIIIVP